MKRPTRWVTHEDKRSDTPQLLTQVVQHLRACNLFQTHLPQLALLYAQFAHVLGRKEVAVRYYRAAQATIVPGSELRLIVDIGLLAANGDFEDLKGNHDRALKLNILADQCRSGSNALLHGVGNFLSSITDPERVSSK